MKVAPFPEFPKNFAQWYARISSIPARTKAASRKRKPIKLARPIKHADQSGHCWYCGLYVPIHRVTMDHLKPMSKGGTNDLDNLVACCFGCNNTKGDMTIEEYRSFLGLCGLFWGEKSAKED